MKHPAPAKKKRRASEVDPSQNGHAAEDAAANGRTISPDAAFREALEASPPVHSPLLLVAIADVLFWRGRDLDDDTCWAAWRALFTAASTSNEFLNNPAGCEALPLARAVAAGEVSWKAGLLFAGLPGMAALRQAGREELSAHRQQSTDAAGLPHFDSEGSLASELAVHARCALWGDRFSTELFDEPQRSIYANWCQRSIALCLNDGTTAAGMSAAAARPLLELAADAARLKRKSRPRLLLTALAEPGASRKKDLKRLAADVASDKRPSFQSDANRVACLRTSWSPRADLLAVSYDTAAPAVHLALEGTTVATGAWDLAVRVDGQPVTFGPLWNATCWFTDDDADYLEIQQILPGGLHIERQMLLSRRERFLVLADCVSQGGDTSIDYRSRLPLAGNVRSENETATRECRWHFDTRMARIFPLALEDDRVRSTRGSLVSTSSGLELRQTATGGLFAPLVIDWSAERSDEPADWRTLTVSENGKPVGPALASGHRVRIGSHQVLVYRAVQRSEELRAVLGFHTRHETVIALFDSDGDVSPLLLVE